MAKEERTPKERETLIFATPEEAGQFREAVTEQVTKTKGEPVDRRREVVGEAVGAEFASHGEGVHMLRTPWEHSEAEHAEVQTLVNSAFEKDLGEALKVARASAHYPRNIDLFHDVLTGEMYQLVVQGEMNKQKMGLTLAVTFGVIILALILIMLLFLL